MECNLLSNEILKGIQNDILPVLPQKIANPFRHMKKDILVNVEEIRLRALKPLMVYLKGKDYFVNNWGEINEAPGDSLILDRVDVEKTLQIMSDFSIYAIEEELRHGFITIRGGHRVGLAGRVVSGGNEVKTLKNISGLNIRIAKEIIGCGEGLIRDAYNDGVKHTLIVSPPNCGKTTLLRDMIRIISNGSRYIRGHKVGLIDERSEIAGCFLGVPQRDVGVRTDVLDACPKAQGIIMMIRSMSPEVVAVDEIGSQRDADAIEDAINAGVKVIATAHGRDMEEVVKRPGIVRLLENNAFEKIVILSRRKGPGTIEEIISQENQRRN